jgi:hypothetical protein
VFPRIKVRDPYKCLGISREANYDEITEARNYLMEAYAGHEASEEAIEMAYDRIFSASFKNRRRSKLTLGRDSADVAPEDNFFNRLRARLDKPSQKVLMQRIFIFGFVAAWSVLLSNETGPTIQLAAAFGLSVLFINQKKNNKELGLAVGVSFIALVAGWLVGTLLEVYLPFLFPPALTPETICSIFSYFSLWFISTYLK